MYTTLGMMKGGGVVPSLLSLSFNEDTSAPFQAVLPTPCVANDLLIIMLTLGSTSNSPTGPPSGWTQLAGNNFGFYKWSAGGAEAPVSVSFSGGADPGFVVLRIQNADPATNPQATTLVENNSPTLNPPDVDPSWPDTNNLLITYAGTSSVQATINAIPSGYTLFQKASGSLTSYGVATKEVSTSAIENPGTFTLTGAASSSSLGRTFTIAVKGT